MDYYHTQHYADRAQTVQVITTSIIRNPRAVEDYIQQYRKFLPEGHNVLINGSVSVKTETGTESVTLGNISQTHKRFAFTYLSE